MSLATLTDLRLQRKLFALYDAIFAFLSGPVFIALLILAILVYFGIQLLTFAHAREADDAREQSESGVS